MESNEPRRKEASIALIELRSRLGQTQQQFAERTLGSSVLTVSRYEGRFPPRGDELMKLAEVAEKNQQSEIADTFRRLFLDEVFAKYGDRLIVTGGSGYLLQKLSTEDELAAAQRFMRQLDVMRGQREPGFVNPEEQHFDAVQRKQITPRKKPK